jgi:drug/metabolite transporter (DMT)-like permease
VQRKCEQSSLPWKRDPERLQAETPSGVSFLDAVGYDKKACQTHNRKKENGLPRFVYVALILLSLLWGGSFYFIKMLVNDFSPWTIAFFRSLSGLLTVTVIMLVLRKPFGLRTFPWIPLTIMSIINTAIPWSLIALGETRLSSSMASILNATTPLWTIIVGLLFFRKKTHLLQWIGIGIATIGLMELLGIRPGSAMTVDMIGVVCLVGSSFFYAVGSQLSKKLLNGYTMFQITFGTLLTCAVASGIMAFSTETIPFGRLASATNLEMIFGLGVMGTGIGYILFYYIIQKGSAEFATMVTYLVPCTALIWGAVLLGEPITWSLLAGLCIILAGVFLAGRKPQSNRNK